jgi:hypothetical protein
MSNPGDFKNNPLYTDITRLDHLSPQPTFSYFWNVQSGRWEPATSLTLDLGSGGFSGSFNAEFDFSETNRLLSGISGQLSDVNDTETHRLLSGISGELGEINDAETHRLLSGISGELGKINDTETHRLLSGVSGVLEDLSISGGTTHVNRADTQPWKLITKTVNQKIEEDFILMEDIPNNLRYGDYGENCYGQDKSIMDDILGNYNLNARLDRSTPETGHPDYFIHAEYIDTGRCVESTQVFHSDTRFAMRQENQKASLINSYELKDFNDLYQRGLVDNIQLYNESPYPIQFHTIDSTFDASKAFTPENDNLLYLFSDTAVKLNSDEAQKIFVKRPHTISGYTIKYSITYKSTGISDIIY